MVYIFLFLSQKLSHKAQINDCELKTKIHFFIKIKNSNKISIYT